MVSEAVESVGPGGATTGRVGGATCLAFCRAARIVLSDARFSRMPDGCHKPSGFSANLLSIPAVCDSVITLTGVQRKAFDKDGQYRERLNRVTDEK
jgi:hypothetical protein